MTVLVRPIADVRGGDLESVGGKAANLGELLHAGFDVPDGFVLTTEAYQRAASAAGVDPQDPAAAAERLRAAPVPEAIAAAARETYAALGARLEPGEILITPSTDPGWTPLFLTAGGLVMEMGGMMSHGAVVAREYGIPAVVGVAGATDRIASGQRVTVDGSAGTVSLE
jgi:pyruvate,water dikinase